MTPQEVIASTTPEVQKVINEILKIEKEYKNYLNLAANKSVETKIVDAILKVIQKEAI